MKLDWRIDSSICTAGFTAGRQQYMRWECEADNARENNSLRKLAVI